MALARFVEWVEAVDVELLVLVQEVFGHVDDPVGSHAAVATD